MWKNTEQNFGTISKTLHWLSAIVVFGLFGLGYWMVDLTYYSQWYQTAPHWHESIGILLCIATIFRLYWRFSNTTPKAIATHSSFVKISATFAHYLIYGLLFTLFITGYLIPTADGRAIEVFTWFSLPALGQLFEDQTDISGLIHQYGAYCLIALSLLHGLAAIKHHFIDKDETLTRMLNKK